MGVLDWVHTVSGRVKDMGQEEERKIPKSVGAKTQPCFTPLFIHGAHDAFGRRQSLVDERGGTSYLL